MITTRGWAAIGAAAALVLLWVGFGESELLAGGIFLIGVVVTGALIVRRSRPDADLTRHVTPLQVHEGDRARVEIRLFARRPLRPLIIEDEVSRLGRARFATARADRNTTVSAHYEIVCRPRGVYQIGPADLIISDPFDLAAVRATSGGVDRLVVYPAIEMLDGYPATRGHDPSVQSAHPTHVYEAKQAEQHGMSSQHDEHSETSLEDRPRDRRSDDDGQKRDDLPGEAVLGGQEEPIEPQDDEPDEGQASYPGEAEDHRPTPIASAQAAVQLSLGSTTVAAAPPSWNGTRSGLSSATTISTVLE